MSATPLDPRTKRILSPIVRTGWGFYAVLALLGYLLVMGNVAWSQQLSEGLVVTGLTDRVSWGLYISAFIYFIGISYGGTCVSAILRLTNTAWRHPITRVAEASTVAALLVAVMMPLFDLGRPEQFVHLILHARLESPLVWDILSIGTYLAASLLFFYIALIPDLALLDKVLPPRIRVRRWFYRLLKMRWVGTPAQVKRIERALLVVSVIIIPVAVSAHTVLSWMFGLSTRTGWHSSIFGPYFVAGALFSGIGVVVVAMAVVRKVYRLQDIITPQHFRHMATILLVFGLLYLYMTLSEYLTMAFQPTADEKVLFDLLTSMPVAPYFWFSTVGLIVVVAMLAMPQTRNVVGVTTAAVLVNVALWIKRFIIVVPSMEVPLIEGDAIAVYSPTWVEWAIMAGSFAAFILVFLVLSKLVPLVSVWETSHESRTTADLHPEASRRGPVPTVGASAVTLVAAQEER